MCRTYYYATSHIKIVKNIISGNMLGKLVKVYMITKRIAIKGSLKNKKRKKVSCKGYSSESYNIALFILENFFVWPTRYLELRTLILAGLKTFFLYILKA